jgi:hypothetical protein
MVRGYTQQMILGVDLDGGPDDDINVLANAARDIYDQCLRDINHDARIRYTPNPVPTDEQQSPNFENLWNELMATIRTGQHQDWLYQWVRYGRHHANIPRLEASILEALLRDESLVVDAIVSGLMEAQPTYDGPIFCDSRRFAGYMAQGPDDFKELIQATITPFMRDDYMLFCVIGFYVKIGIAIADEVASGDHDEGRPIMQFIQAEIEQYRSWLWNPFSVVPLEVRRQLAETNLMQLYVLLIQQAWNYLEQFDKEELGCRVHQFIVHNIARTAVSPDRTIALFSVIADDYGWEEFLPGQAVSASLNYVPEVDTLSRTAYWARRSNRQDESEDEPDVEAVDESDEAMEDEDGIVYVDELQPTELEDVRFEPDGPPIQVSNHAVASHAPGGVECTICADSFDESGQAMQIPCGHLFHFQCLDSLINGISPFSNICPNCRQKICDRRPRKPILD